MAPRFPPRMFDDDYPLLNGPALNAVILQECAAGPATMERCLERLARLYKTAGDDPPLAADGLASKMARQFRHLLAAELIAPQGDAFAITDRGRAVLAENPTGLAQADLMVFPEYAAYSHARAGHAAGMDPRLRSYQEGYAARQGGRPFTVNPYTLNSVDHTAWENGWMQALDDEPPPIAPDDTPQQ